MLKKIIMLMVSVSFIFSLTGCTPSEEQIKKEVLSFLEKKYGEEFVIIRYTKPSLFYTSHMFGVRPKDNENIVFTAYRSREKGVMCDNYVIKLLKPEIEKRIDEIISKYFDDYKIDIWDGGSDDNLFQDEYGKDTTIDDLIDDNISVFLSLYIYIDESNSSAENIEPCAIEISLKCLNPTVRIYPVFSKYYKDLNPKTVFEDYGYENEWHDERFYLNLSKDEYIELKKEVENND